MPAGNATRYVLIITTQTDISTRKVIDWLCVLKQPYIVINENTDVYLDYLSIGKEDSFCRFELSVKEKVSGKQYTIGNEHIASVWYRRGYFFLKNNVRFRRRFISKEVEKGIVDFQSEQNHTIAQYLYGYICRNYRHLNKIEDNLLNKLEVLEIAKSIGFDIPPSFVTGRKRDLVFDGTLINKSLDSPVHLKMPDSEAVYASLTEIISSEREVHIPRLFSPSLFQDNIKKDFEIRTFYLDEQTFSMAIFSQNDEQTRTDFRNYNEEKPNRNIPYRLPDSISTRIKMLMKKIGLNSGSIDMIYSDPVYYFLEVNPIGQYDMVSIPCNYFLHKRIAQYLAGNEP